MRELPYKGGVTLSKHKSSEQHNRTALDKTLNPANIWAIALGSIIGWGAFIQSPNWMMKAGGPLPLVIGFIIGGLLMLVVGRSYAYMIAKYPVAGGEFAYAYTSFGSTAAYICGWMLSVGYFGIVALNATAVPVLFSIMTPGLLQVGYLWTVAGYPVYLGEVAVSLALIWIMGFINYRGVKSTGNLQLLLCALLCGAVLVIVVGIMATGNFTLEHLTPAANQNDVPLWKGVVLIIALAPFLYVGFDCIPQAAEEFNFPPNKTFLLICSAIAAGALIYIGLAAVPAAVIPWQDMVNLQGIDGEPAPWRTGAMIQQALGTAGIVFVVIAVLAGMFTGVNGFYLSSSRLLFGMARARMMPKWFSYIHPEYKTPTHNVLFVMLTCSIAPFFGREVLNWVVDMASVGTGIGYFFTCAGALVVVTKGLVPKEKGDISPVMAGAGALISLVIIALMIVPGMPAFLSKPCWYALGVWVIIGIICYAQGMKRFRHTTQGMARYLILGDKSQLNDAELQIIEAQHASIDDEIDSLEETLTKDVK